MRIHFIGIGGVSMSALAKLMLVWEHEVSGSDVAFNSNVLELMELGAKVYVGIEKEVVEKADLIVYSASIKEDDLELNYAREFKKRIIPRSYFLKEVSEEFNECVAVSGTHGKTTVSQMLGEILLKSNREFTLHAGGQGKNGNLIYKGRDIFVTEACEYNRSFLALRPNVSVILNVEYDHPDTYKNMGEIYESFNSFSLNTKRGGTVVVSKDSEFYNIVKCSYKHICTYSLKSIADFTATNIINYCNGVYGFQIVEKGHPNIDIKLKVAGIHNVENALSAYATARVMGLAPKTIQRGLEAFMGVKGRMECLGSLDGATIYYDYAHHPTEIKTAIRTALELSDKGRLKVVFQPHTLSRTEALLEEFTTSFQGANEVYIFKEYLARKEEGGLSAYELYERMKGGEDVFYYANSLELCQALADSLEKGDLLLFLGAGDVGEIGRLLLK